MRAFMLTCRPERGVGAGRSRRKVFLLHRPIDAFLAGEELDGIDLHSCDLLDARTPVDSDAAIPIVAIASTARFARRL